MLEKLKINYFSLVRFLINQSRWKKTFLLITVDYCLLVMSFELSLSIRINEWYWPTSESRVLLLVAPLLAIPIFYFFGLYQSFIRFTSLYSLRIITLGITIYTMIWFLIVLIPSLIVKPYDFLIINWLLTVFFIGGIRFFARAVLTRDISLNLKSNVMIYGAGYSGTRLGSAIGNDNETNLVGYIDDDQEKYGLFIEGKKIFNPNELEKLITERDIDEVLIAMPSISKSTQSEIIQSLTKYPVTLRKMPDIVDLVHGKVAVADLRKVRIEDLLNREIRSPNKTLLAKDISGKSILVTGAGGSIGSELCREIIKLDPRMLILFEISEVSLYLIEQALSEKKHKTTVLAILGDINDGQRLRTIIKKYNVETIFHTAAYKHVPMVEKNTIAGIKCNIFGTLECIEAAIAENVNSFVFISTDKAVRPTNIMGATKRFAELILQTKATKILEDKKIRTRISMVRFGNVLDSSGSVVPLFRQQIERGGPVTVTDPNIIRYFMTMNEAAQLVIQSGSMGSGGEIFLLDMGEAISILQLAKDMIRLSGMSIRDKDNPDGDIKIKFTGLRPGEKLYEELLVDDSATATKHKKIMKANDKGITMEQLRENLLELEEAARVENYKKIKQVFINTVEGFKPSN